MLKEKTLHFMHISNVESKTRAKASKIYFEQIREAKTSGEAEAEGKKKKIII